MTETEQAGRWTLTIHGGSGIIRRESTSADQDRMLRAGLSAALEAGRAVLAGGGGALDAVEAAVRVMEDDPVFNAGCGAALADDGAIELDAAIMDGRTRMAGAVAATTTTRYPVALARRVMEATPHVFLGGPGADAFARDSGLEQVAPGWFATDARRRQLAELKASGGAAFDVDMKYGTVGAVARDVRGHVAAATSTGGVTGKRFGRIGDSPVIGAGTYADDRGAAISATGAGEFFLREGVAHEISARVRMLGESVAEAADAALAGVVALGGTGGVIVVDARGQTVWRFATPGMHRATATSDGTRRVALYGDEG